MASGAATFSGAYKLNNTAGIEAFFENLNKSRNDKCFIMPAANGMECYLLHVEKD